MSDSCTPPGTIAGTQSASAIVSTAAPHGASASSNWFRKVWLMVTSLDDWKT